MSTTLRKGDILSKVPNLVFHGVCSFRSNLFNRKFYAAIYGNLVWCIPHVLIMDQHLIIVWLRVKMRKINFKGEKKTAFTLYEYQVMT